LRKGDDFFLLQVAHFLESGLSPWATALCTMLFPAQGKATSNSCGVWQQVQRQHDNVLSAVLRTSVLPLATKLSHAPAACQAAVCSSALDVRDRLRGLKLEGGSLQTYSAELSSMPELQWMHLFSVVHEIIYIGIAALGLHLAALSSLRSLDLTYNNFKTDGAAALGLHLASLSTLQYLGLSCNNFENDAATALGPHIAALLYLQSLNPSCNKFQGVGAAALGL
jgi:hypothetical protein